MVILYLGAAPTDPGCAVRRIDAVGSQHAVARPADRCDKRVRLRMVAVTLLMPLLAATVGIDGGPIFQLIATEDLDRRAHEPPAPLVGPTARSWIHLCEERAPRRRSSQRHRGVPQEFPLGEW